MPGLVTGGLGTGGPLVTGGLGGGVVGPAGPGGGYFAARHFAPRYFAPHYFPDGGVPDTDPEPAVCAPTDLFAVGHAWLTGQLQAHASQPVVYQRGESKIAVCATLGRKLLKLHDGDGGIRMEWTDRDFLVPAASLVLDAAAVLPRRGDRIRQHVGGQVEIYEVTPYDGEPPWTWCDPYRRMVRIHTKLIATE